MFAESKIIARGHMPIHGMEIALRIKLFPRHADLGVTLQGCELGRIAVNSASGHAYGIGYVWLPNMVMVLRMGSWE